jgi:hypothetical protein
MTTATMTADPAANEAPATTRNWTIWTEGFAAIGEAETAWQLNEAPIHAGSLDDAVLQYSRSSESGHLFHAGGTAPGRTGAAGSSTTNRMPAAHSDRTYSV